MKKDTYSNKFNKKDRKFLVEDYKKGDKKFLLEVEVI